MLKLLILYLSGGRYKVERSNRSRLRFLLSMGWKTSTLSQSGARAAVRGGNSPCVKMAEKREDRVRLQPLLRSPRAASYFAVYRRESSRGAGNYQNARTDSETGRLFILWTPCSSIIPSRDIADASLQGCSKVIRWCCGLARRRRDHLGVKQHIYVSSTLLSCNNLLIFE